MRLRAVQISDAAHDDFVMTHPGGDLIQRTGWAHVKEPQWYSRRIAVADDEGLRGVALLLFRRVPVVGVTLCYIGHGFVCDFQDTEVVAALRDAAVAVARRERAFVVKMDPEVERESDPGLLARLERLGFHHRGFTLGMPDSQPRFTMVTDISSELDQVLASFSSRTRSTVRKSQKTGLVCRPVDRSRLGEFQDLMRETGARDGFAIRSRAYFERLFDALGDDAQLFMTTLDTGAALERARADLEAAQTAHAKVRKAMARKGANATALENELGNVETRRRRVEENISRLEAAAAGGRSEIVLSAAILTFCGERSYYLYGASADEFRELYPNYLMQWTMIAFAKDRGARTYDFGGVSGRVDGDDDPKYSGLYEFKKRWGSRLVEKIGEFDLVLNRPVFLLFDKALPVAREMGRRLVRHRQSAG